MTPDSDTWCPPPWHVMYTTVTRDVHHSDTWCTPQWHVMHTTVIRVVDHDDTGQWHVMYTSDTGQWHLMHTTVTRDLHHAQWHVKDNEIHDWCTRLTLGTLEWLKNSIKNHYGVRNIDIMLQLSCCRQKLAFWNLKLLCSCRRNQGK
jgi:hypothetical protein